MATITARPKKDGSVTYTATIRLKDKGVVVFTKSASFDREAAAKAWVKRTESEARRPGGIAAAKPKVTLSEAIDRYVSASRKDIGRTKAQVLEAIRRDAIAEMECAAITSSDIVAYASRLGQSCKPQTVNNYISHLGAVFALGSTALDAPLNEQAMRDAIKACKRLGITSKSAERNRRPTLDELRRLEAAFVIRAKRKNSPPMHMIMAFAAFSARRQEEITLLRWDDLESGRILVRDMKHPGDKVGNNVWVELVPEAEEIIRLMPRTGPLIFPYSTDAISAAFTRTCKVLGIEDLRFHDLRHEGASRLFEMGRTIPQVASVTGHRTWASLQRYSHLRQTGDKLAEWKWREALSIMPENTQPKRLLKPVL